MDSFAEEQLSYVTLYIRPHQTVSVLSDQEYRTHIWYKVRRYGMLDLWSTQIFDTFCNEENRITAFGNRTFKGLRSFRMEYRHCVNNHFASNTPGVRWFNGRDIRTLCLFRWMPGWTLDSKAYHHMSNHGLLWHEILQIELLERQLNPL